MFRFKEGDTKGKTAWLILGCLIVLAVMFTSCSSPIPGGSDDTSSVTGTAVYSQSGGTVTKSDQAITASEQDESAVIITDSGVFTLTDSTVYKSGDTSSLDDFSFYGLNAAILAESGSKITLSDVMITTTGSGANGVFATGEGSTIDLTNVTIDCTNTGAHGVDATLAGILNLVNVDITTAGNGASAGIATDWGGGTITVTGGTVSTSGTKSPPIYSTGEITVTGATMEATNSEAVAIEGKNSVTLTDTTISGATGLGRSHLSEHVRRCRSGYRPFYDDRWYANGRRRPLFYTTNTQAVINLEGATLVNPSGILLKASAGDWGTSGSNGAGVAFTADGEALHGDIVCDSISTVNLILNNSTTLEGSIDAEHTAKSVALTLDTTSVWEVAGDSYLASLTDADMTLANIHSNGYTVYYDASDTANDWLNGETYDLPEGGKLTPST